MRSEREVEGKGWRGCWKKEGEERGMGEYITLSFIVISMKWGF